MFQEKDIKELNQNVFSMIGDQWALLSAGTAEKNNAMTISWGGFGVLFHKNVVTVYVRPQRHTYQFMEENTEFTLSFLPHEANKSVLLLYGSKSGADMDKAKESGLTVAMAGETAPYFNEAELVFVCKKLLCQPLDPNGFVDPAIHEFYVQKDYSHIFIGEITRVLERTKGE